MQPPLERADPHHRRRADEGDVGGEDDARVGHVDDQVAVRMRGPDLDEFDLPASDVEVQPAGERVRRPRERYGAVVVWGGHAPKEAATRAQRPAERVGDGALPGPRRACNPEADSRPWCPQNTRADRASHAPPSRSGPSGPNWPRTSTRNQAAVPRSRSTRPPTTTSSWTPHGGCTGAPPRGPSRRR